MIITRPKKIFYILFFALVQPVVSYALTIKALAVQDTTRQDTVLIKPDSILKKIPERIIREDTTFQKYQNFPWKMSKAAMNQYFYEDLGDLLNYFPGIYTRDLGSSGQKLGVSHDGSNDKETALFIDGHPYYDPICGRVDLNLIPVGFTNTITLERGLSTPLITSNAEMLSLSLQSYQEEEPYSQVSYHKAPYGFSDIDVIFGQRFSRKMCAIVGGIIKSYDGKTDAYSFEQQNFRGKVDYQLTSSWLFNYSWISNKINRRVPDAALAVSSYQPGDATEKVSRIDHTLNIKGRIFKSDFLNFSANLFYSSLSDILKEKNFNLQFTDLSRYTGFNFQMKHRFMGQQITSGSDLSYEWTDADQVGKNNATFGSVFIQDDWAWRERLGIRILGSYKLHSAHDSQLNGGFSSFFSLAKNSRITASARQTIRYPTFFEMDAKTNFIGNPDLKPEFHKKVELGVEWEIASQFSLKYFLYRKHIQHAIQINALDSLKATFLNQNEVQYSGLDCQFTWTFFTKFQLNTLFSIIENIGLNDQPEVTATSYLQYSDNFFQDDVRPTVRLEGRYFGKRNSTISNSYFYEPYQKILNPIFLVNAHAILDFGNLKIFIVLENILDAQYQLTYGYPMNERTLHYGLRWDFWN